MLCSVEYDCQIEGFQICVKMADEQRDGQLCAQQAQLLED